MSFVVIVSQFAFEELRVPVFLFFSIKSNSSLLPHFIGLVRSMFSICTRGSICQNEKNIWSSYQYKIASTGNRTRAARVAGEHSTTEPSMLLKYFIFP